jgi:hypothetical protein
MSQKRSLTGLLVASLGLAAGLAVFSAPVSAADCSAAVKKDSVKKVCTKGGQAEVKKAMKVAMEDANKAGAKGPDGKALGCKTCHKELTNFALNDGAEDLFDKYLDSHMK